MAPITGAAGVGGCGLIVMLPEGADVQPDSFVTVNL